MLYKKLVVLGSFWFIFLHCCGKLADSAPTRITALCARDLSDISFVSGAHQLLVSVPESLMSHYYSDLRLRIRRHLIYRKLIYSFQ